MSPFSYTLNIIIQFHTDRSIRTQHSTRVHSIFKNRKIQVRMRAGTSKHHVTGPLCAADTDKPLHSTSNTPRTCAISIQETLTMAIAYLLSLIHFEHACDD